MTAICSEKVSGTTKLAKKTGVARHNTGFFMKRAFRTIKVEIPPVKTYFCF